MIGDESTPNARWAAELEAGGKKLLAQAKAVLAIGDDPFALRDLLERCSKGDDTAELKVLMVPPEISKRVATTCLEATAEFWQRFSSAASAAKWVVHGSTQRRLVANAFFIELKDDTVLIDGITGKHSPHVAGLIRTLKPHVDGLALGHTELQGFCDLLAKAYDSLGGKGELPIEAIFRQCVLLIQPAAFWSNIDPAKLVALSRQAFRARLSAILAANMRPSTGREMRLTPTVNRKDVWELFSPAEGRIVQVGRMAFIEG